MDNGANNGNIPRIFQEQLRLHRLLTIADILLCLMVFLNVIVQRVEPPEITRSEVKICTTTPCIYEAYRIKNQVDANVNPCDDFHQFLCKNSFEDPISAVKREATGQIINLYKEPIKHNDHLMVKTMKKLFEACLREASENSIEKNAENIKKALKKAGGWPLLEDFKWDETKFDWLQATYKFRELGYQHQVFLELSVIENPISKSSWMLKVSLAKLEAIDKEPAIEYAALLGADRSRASDVIDEVNNYIFKLNQNDRNRDGMGLIVTPAQFENRLGLSISWLEFINRIVGPAAKISTNDNIFFMQPEILTSGLKLLSKAPKRILANYMMWKVVQEIAPNILFNLPDKYSGPASFWKVASLHEIGCFNQIKETFPLYPNPIDVMYVQKYLSISKMNMVEQIAKNIQAAFLDMIAKSNWMDKKDKQAIIEHIKRVILNIGAPKSYFKENIFDVINIHMGKADNGDFLNLLLQLRRNYESFLYKHINGSTHTTSSLLWNLLDVTDMILEGSHAFIHRIEIPATILQGTIFNANRPNYLNYGYLGSFISTQFAAQFIKLLAGNAISNKTKQGFEKIKNCLNKELLNNYEFCRTTINNNKVCGIIEGLDTYILQQSLSRSILYLAYEKWINDNGIEPNLSNIGYTNQQLFWISTMSTYCRTNPTIRKEMQSFLVSVIIGCHKAVFANDFYCTARSIRNICSSCYEF